MNQPLNPATHPHPPMELARFNMIEQQIRPWNVYDGQTLEVLGRVRREDFAPPAYRSLAFMDIQIPLRGNAEEAIRKGECMLSPKVEARLLQDLQITRNDRVLEIGAGSGFMAALLAQMARQVVSLEINPELAAMAQSNLQRAGVQNAAVRVADGATGLVPDGPFDVILLSGSVAAVPQELLALLRDGGRLAVVVGEEPMMRATFVRRHGDRFETTQPWDTVVPRLCNFPEPTGFHF
ncbi:MAG: protein-L-isoaspartate O-methyltransferase family protein [Giesbergeria sp.]